MKLFSQDLVEMLNRHGNQICLVTGRFFLSELGLLQKLYSFLRYHGFKVYVFDQIPSEPTDDVIRLGADKFIENNCEALLAVGGGSVMDAAKGMAILAACGGEIYQYKNLSEFPVNPFPVIAAPTTCGSGSEATRYGVFSNRDPKEKFTIKSTAIIPCEILLDPQLLSSLPEDELIITAFDASSHLIETLLFNMASTSDSAGRCLDGLNIIFSTLQEAVETRSEASLACLQDAAFLAGQIINVERTGLPHTIGNKISGFMPIKHGLINAIAIPPCLAFLEEKQGEDPLFENRLTAMNQLLKSHQLSKESVSAALKAFYQSFPVRFQGKAQFSTEVETAIIDQTARDAGLFEITPKRLKREDLEPVLARVIEAINEDY